MLFHLVWHAIIFEELLVPGKFHCLTLDKDEENPFGSIIKQFRSARDLFAGQSGGRSSTIKGFQRLKGIDHLSARRKIRSSHFLLDLNCQRIIWVT